MTTISGVAAILLALIVLPAVVLLWATESKQQRARRWRKAGKTYKVIGERLGVSATTAKRYAMA
tara:strand:+ start:1006 stop:1197 length:192 start_codon:yes stop_codon:yes gene_type:complete